MADNSAASVTGAGEGKSSDRNGNRDRNQRGRGRGGRGRGGRDDRSGKGRRGGFGRDDGSKRKKDVGRGNGSKRERVQRTSDNKERIKQEGGDTQEGPFSKEEIAAEPRKPKHKVAVMIGYAGSGYKGMQINAQEKTIEGDLFKAFVAAGAISKANADDPKKSSLVRCARTDKGVHAAGNVISLKLIVEEPDIVRKINEALPSQIRVWGIERTNGAFSCYQTCDSRWYEYLIPTYSFLPPHPESFMGKKLVESAEQEGIFETYKALQEDVSSFWADADENYVKPILEKLDPIVRKAVESLIYNPTEEAPEQAVNIDSKGVGIFKSEPIQGADTSSLKRAHSPADDDMEPPKKQPRTSEEPPIKEASVAVKDSDSQAGNRESSVEINFEKTLSPLEQAVKDVKAALILAKKAYRISDVRRSRVQEALKCYLGTCNFHNYTIQKSFGDPSAKRVIKSFNVGPDPIIINDTEWLSLKVHGQSFMMHQIRKMVAMVALVVRSGAKTEIIKESYGPSNISIPKAPSLGLLLERPVFDSYNNKAKSEYNREKLDFNKYQKEMDEFKQREIYDRIFREEERDHQFHAFFHHIDHHRTDYFLWVTAGGIGAARQSKAPTRTDGDSDDEVDVKGEEG